ncbi:hypothetical protein VA596_47070 [Amycolatopsis sp., V23-08]|uniref:Uncharacterized protein n=1 Tax=Amycolatopsis heterodermiae TaxID=3110235 RepID=A0ABU5RMY6_9PSEU|nr:hypothetical protein [Amycolatopsis sp., V23-08]MEA5367160.1 hypothetical protein [Amycolatopsis sp., V23-08]
MEDHHNLPASGSRRWFDRVLEWLFAAEEDARAEARGWQVHRAPNGRNRTYRDPRWDTVHACRDCGGHGLSPTDGAACPACAGTGVIRSATETAVPVADGWRGART